MTLLLKIIYFAFVKNATVSVRYVNFVKKFTVVFLGALLACPVLSHWHLDRGLIAPVLEGPGDPLSSSWTKLRGLPNPRGIIHIFQSGGENQSPLVDFFCVTSSM